MKSTIIAAILLLTLSAMMLTGFQCGSAEFTSAKLYISRGDFVNAERTLAQEVQKNPVNAEAWFYLGDVRLSLTPPNIQGMMDAFDKALAIPAGQEFAEKINYDKNRAWSLSLNSAVIKFNRSITIQKDDAATKEMKDSIAILRTGAIDDYKTAIILRPDSLVAYSNLAIAYRAAEQYDKQIATLQDAAARRPSPETYRAIVQACYVKADAAEAKSDSVTARAADAIALQTLGKIRELQPDSAEVLTQMIEIYIRENRAPEAKPLIRESLAKNPGNKIYQYNLGVLLMQTDSLSSALPYFQKAVDIDPAYVPALKNLASAHMKVGNELKQSMKEGQAPDPAIKAHFAAAVETMLKLIEIEPKNATYWDILATAYVHAGNTAKARDAMKKADDIRAGK
jgi:predicted Zn-dependent protease